MKTLGYWGGTSFLFSFFKWFFAANSDNVTCGFGAFPSLGIDALAYNWNFDFSLTYIGVGACCSALLRVIFASSPPLGSPSDTVPYQVWCSGPAVPCMEESSQPAGCLSASLAWIAYSYLSSMLACMVPFTKGQVCCQYSKEPLA